MKLSLSAYDMTVSIENSRRSLKTLLKLISDFNKVARQD